MTKPNAGSPLHAGAVPEAWVRTELARDSSRPYPMDYMQALFTDLSEIHGDRAFGDEKFRTIAPFYTT